MFLIITVSFFLLSARISYKYQKSILQCLTVVSAALIMVMYVLAFFRGLKLLGALALAAFIYVAAVSVREGKESPALLIKQLIDPCVILFVLCAAFVTLATSGRIFTWWDDINFWSSDARQLFFMNGFPDRYGNVSPEFGDYPPVTSLVKWLFLQIKPGEYTESLQFAGYFFLNAVFLLPLLDSFCRAIRRAGFGKYTEILLSAISFAAVMLFPGVFNGIIYYGTPADITMAIIYGALLSAMADKDENDRAFYYIRIALYTSVLLLTKSVGFEWALFALIFYALFGRREKTVLIPVAFAGMSISSWLLFCLINRRVAKLTGAGIRMATSGNYSAPDNTADKFRYFMEGFWLQPMHADHNLTLDLSTGAVLVIIFIAVLLLLKTGVVGKREFSRLTAFLLLTGLAAYGIVFAAHITIFQTEEQYLDAYAMAVSIARYCAPFSLGSLYLIMSLLLGAEKPDRNLNGVRYAVFGCILLICIASDYKGVYNYLSGYRKNLAENETYIRDMVGDEGRLIVQGVSDRQYWGKRVLVFRDGHSYYWVHNAYISKEASPVALIYDSFLTEEDTGDTIVRKIQESHASYFYVEDNDGISRELFSSVLKDKDFEPGKVYSIEGIGY